MQELLVHQSQHETFSLNVPFASNIVQNHRRTKSVYALRAGGMYVYGRNYSAGNYPLTLVRWPARLNSLVPHLVN